MPRYNVTGQTRVVGVIGWPVEHSLSPPMHNAEFERLKLDYIYVAWPVDPEKLQDAVRGFSAAGVVGINVTIPHKASIIPLLDDIAPEANLVGAVNTVKFSGGRISGWNTDVHGWLDDIQQDVLLRDSAVCIVGAGGVARAIAAACGLGGAARVFICNRTADKAFALAETMQAYFENTQYHAGCLADVDCGGFFRACDVAVNATSVGMASEPGIPVPADWLREDQYVYDTIYTPPLTELLREARDRGCGIRNGLGMLARQGARAFEIWTGVLPDAAHMESVLRHVVR